MTDMQDATKNNFDQRGGREDIDIDCAEAVPGGLPCLVADGNAEETSYLAVIPGTLLADLYSGKSFTPAH